HHFARLRSTHIRRTTEDPTSRGSSQVCLQSLSNQRCLALERFCLSRNRVPYLHVSQGHPAHSPRWTRRWPHARSARPAPCCTASLEKSTEHPCGHPGPAGLSSPARRSSLLRGCGPAAAVRRLLPAAPLHAGFVVAGILEPEHGADTGAD